MAQHNKSWLFAHVKCPTLVGRGMQDELLYFNMRFYNFLSREMMTQWIRHWFLKPLIASDTCHFVSISLAKASQWPYLITKEPKKCNLTTYPEGERNGNIPGTTLMTTTGVPLDGLQGQLCVLEAIHKDRKNNFHIYISGSHPPQHNKHLISRSRSYRHLSRQKNSKS